MPGYLTDPASYAAGIAISASGNINATNVQEAVYELDSEKAPATGIAQSAVTNLVSDLSAKAPLASPTFTGTVTLPSLTSIGNVSSTELEYLDGVTSSIQNQLNSKLNSAGGKVLQVVQGTQTSTFTTTSTTFADTGLTASITPISSSNKILVFANFPRIYKNPSSDPAHELRLLRGATVVTTVSGSYNQNNDANDASQLILNLDSPSTSSSVTYKTQARIVFSGSVSFFEATMILMEVSA